MPRIGLLNMIFGFCVLAIAAAAGAFVATDLTQGFVHDKAMIDSWQLMLDKSAHGHTNLFALLHICFGLTLPYSRWKAPLKMAQTAGLMLGTLAMGPGMMVKARILPHDGNNVIDIIIGGMLSAALAALVSHCMGLGMKWYHRS